MASTYH